MIHRKLGGELARAAGFLAMGALVAVFVSAWACAPIRKFEGEGDAALVVDGTRAEREGGAHVASDSGDDSSEPVETSSSGTGSSTKRASDAGQVDRSGGQGELGADAFSDADAGGCDAPPSCVDSSVLERCDAEQRVTESCAVGCEVSDGGARCAPLVGLGGSCRDSLQCATGTDCVDGVCCETDCAEGQVCDPGGLCDCPGEQTLIEGACKLPQGASCTTEGPICDGACEATESGSSICCEGSCADDEVCHSGSYECVECESEPATPTCNAEGDVEHCVDNAIVVTDCGGAGCADGACYKADGASCAGASECASGHCANSAGGLRCCPQSCSMGCDASGACYMARGEACGSAKPCAPGSECVDGLCCEAGCSGGQVCGPTGACECPSGQQLSGGVCKLVHGAACTSGGGTPCLGSCEETESGESICCSETCGGDTICHSRSFICVECEVEPNPPACNGDEQAVRCVNNSREYETCSAGCSAGTCLGENGTTCSSNSECGSDNCVSGAGVKRCCPSNCARGCDANGDCYQCEGDERDCYGGHVAACDDRFWKVTQSCNSGCYSLNGTPNCKKPSGGNCTNDVECASGECVRSYASGQWVDYCK